MFSPTSASFHEQMSKVFTAVQRAAFDDRSGSGEDPLLAVPVRLLPLVQSARSMRSDLAQAFQTRTTLEALLDLADEPLLAVDSQRRMLFANAAARRILLQGEPFCRDAGRLQLSNWQDDQQLECALRNTPGEAADGLPSVIARLIRLIPSAGRPVFLLRLRASLSARAGSRRADAPPAPRSHP